MSIDAELQSLLEDSGASRVTLRRETPGETFPVIAEALADGVFSIRDVHAPNMPGQPVVLRALAGRQVVQDDCEAEFPDDEAFHVMLGMYGGMQAQIVTPIVSDGRTQAIVSLHQLGRTRAWTDADAARCGACADRVAALLGLTETYRCQAR